MNPRTSPAADWTPGVRYVLADDRGIMYPMSSHLTVLTIGLAAGSILTYLVMALAEQRIRPRRRRVSGILEAQCPPRDIIRHRYAFPPSQPTIFDRAQPLPRLEVPDSPAALFLRSADTQPDSE